MPILHGKKRANGGMLQVKYELTQSLLDKLKPQGVPVPSRGVFIGAMRILLSYATFNYTPAPGATSVFSKQDLARLKTTYHKLCSSQALYNGRKFERTWLGFVSLSYMVRRFIKHYSDYGAANWDVVLMKILSVVLQSALACRAGEVTRTTHYTGDEFMAWKDVDMHLIEDGPEGVAKPCLSNLRATVTLRFEKGDKNNNFDNPQRHLRPLASQVHMCPVSLLLVNAMRHGQVYGTNLREVLQHAAADNRGHRIRWKFPDRPIICSITPACCRLDEPAGIHQIDRTIKSMALISGLINRAYSHALRLGAARDLALTSKATAEDASSFASESVRTSLGHKKGTFNKGVTEQYIGGTTREFHYEIATNAALAQAGTSTTRRKRGTNSRIPHFAKDHSFHHSGIHARITREDLAQYREQTRANDPEAFSHLPKSTHGLRDYIRRERTAALKEGAEYAPLSATALGEPLPDPSPPIGPEPAVPLQRRIRRSPQRRNEQMGNIDDGGPHEDEDAAAASISTITSAASPSFSTTTENITADAEQNAERRDSGWYKSIDPRLLSEDDMLTAEVDEARLTAIHNSIAGGEDVDERIESEAAAAATAFDAALTQLSTSTVPQSSQRHQNDEVQEEEADIIDRVLEGSLNEVDESEYNDTAKWIQRFAEMNTINRKTFARLWLGYIKGERTFEESLAPHCTFGNSRNSPTPFVFYCKNKMKNGCDFNTIQLHVVLRHEERCTSDPATTSVEKEGGENDRVLSCPHPGCLYRTKGTQQHLDRHVRRQHAFEPKPCGFGCGAILHSTTEYQKHTEDEHIKRWPTRCLFPACTAGDKLFKRLAYGEHLRSQHGCITSDDRTRYFPPPMPRKVWVKRSGCIVDGCSSQVSCPRAATLCKHLVSAHKFDKEDAQYMLDADPTLWTYTQKQMTRAPTRIRVALGDGLEARRKRSNEQEQLKESKKVKGYKKRKEVEESSNI